MGVPLFQPTEIQKDIFKREADTKYGNLLPQLTCLWR